MKKKKHTKNRGLKAFRLHHVAVVHVGHHPLNPQDLSVLRPLNSKLILLHHLREDHQTRPPLQKDQKLSPSVLYYDLMRQEFSHKDLSYTHHYLLRSF